MTQISERRGAASSGASDATSGGPPSSSPPGTPSPPGTTPQSEESARALRTRHLLFLCTHNSARSLMAEAILNRRAFRLDGPSRFRAFSAGDHPAYAPHPLTLETLRAQGYATTFAKPMHWTRFARDAPPRIDAVIQLCARDPFAPDLPAAWVRAEWILPDPVSAPGGPAPRRAAFARVFERLDRWITALLELEALEGPLDLAKPADAADRLRRIGAL